jgi:hypothetical protein
VWDYLLNAADSTSKKKKQKKHPKVLYDGGKNFGKPKSGSFRKTKAISPSFVFHPVRDKKNRNFRLGFLWAMRDSNPRPSGCKPDALNQLS